jgi:hypothetical protein
MTKIPDKVLVALGKSSETIAFETAAKEIRQRCQVFVNNLGRKGLIVDMEEQVIPPHSKTAWQKVEAINMIKATGNHGKYYLGHGDGRTLADSPQLAEKKYGIVKFIIRAKKKKWFWGRQVFFTSAVSILTKSNSVTPREPSFVYGEVRTHFEDESSRHEAEEKYSLRKELLDLKENLIRYTKIHSKNFYDFS